MRVALGSGSRTVGAPVPDESMVLGLAGGVLGRAVGAAGSRPFVVFWPGSLPRAEEVRLDWQVLLFAVAASLVSGLLIRPGAGHARVRPQAGADLAGEARSVAGNSRRRTGCSSLPRSRWRWCCWWRPGCWGARCCACRRSTPAMNVRNVLIARTALSPSAFSTPGRTRAAWQDLLDRARRVPGVRGGGDGRYGSDAPGQQSDGLLGDRVGAAGDSSRWRWRRA